MEVWKDIDNYNGDYRISNLGNIQSLKSGHPKNLRLVLNGDGYLVVELYNQGVPKMNRVNVLVAMSFLNHKPEKSNLIVDHIDGNKLNNHVENLQLITQRANVVKQKKNIPNQSSKYTGVTWCKREKKWVARILVNGKREHLGYFDDDYKGHLAYQNRLKQVQK